MVESAAGVDLVEEVQGAVAEDSPWSAGPLIGAACGPLIYFPMSWSRAEEASAYATEVAASLGLNCFDPQARQLRP
ncbi:hypothetical protein GTZ85_41670 [Streptomyces sp. SID5474]|nr:hypothetical protein [Streptomyces sp. SID5474]